MALETRSFTPSVQTYFGWRNPPHFTVHQDGPNVKIYQHYPINVAARALMQGQTPLVNAIEIELAWLSTEIHTIEHEMKKKLGDLMRWIEQETGIVRSSRAFYQPFDAYGTQATQRMTELEWKDFNGWCGRQHIPGQENSDPGVIDIDFLLSYNVQGKQKKRGCGDIYCFGCKVDCSSEAFFVTTLSYLQIVCMTSDCKLLRIQAFLHLAFKFH